MISYMCFNASYCHSFPQIAQHANELGALDEQLRALRLQLQTASDERQRMAAAHDDVVQLITGWHMKAEEKTFIVDNQRKAAVNIMNTYDEQPQELRA